MRFIYRCSQASSRHNQWWQYCQKIFQRCRNNSPHNRNTLRFERKVSRDFSDCCIWRARDVSKFSEFSRDTAELYVDLYPWYYMPSSVHKLLVHGSDIIKHFGAIPIGELSEDAAEARNKDFRKYRESHSRKVSRTVTNEDILHNLVLSSDPKITSLKTLNVKTKYNGSLSKSPRASAELSHRIWFWFWILLM